MFTNKQIEKGEHSISIQYLTLKDVKKNSQNQKGLFPIIPFLFFVIGIIFMSILIYRGRINFSMDVASASFLIVAGVISFFIKLKKKDLLHSLINLKVDQLNETVTFLFDVDERESVRSYREFSHFLLSKRIAFYGAKSIFDKHVYYITLVDKFGVETVISREEYSIESSYNLLNDLTEIIPIPIKDLIKETSQASFKIAHLKNSTEGFALV